MRITPNSSVGRISLGMSRVEVHAILGEDFEPFVKDVGERETDAYDEIGAHIYYDQQECVEYVELFEPAAPVLDDVQLMGEKISKLKRTLQYKFKPNDVGYVIDDVGVFLIVADNIVEGVGVFKKGYSSP